MARTVWLFLVSMSVFGACAEASSDDDDDGHTDSSEPDPDDGETLDCAELELDIIGPTPPAVGDSWTLWLRCDGATMTGTMVLRFEPPEIASVESNTATFLTSGEALMRFQVGNRRVEETITVEP